MDLVSVLPSRLRGIRLDSVMLSLAATKARPWWVRMQVGAAAVLFGAVLRSALSETLADRLAYVTFFPAVTIAALLGGMVAGLSATLMCAALVLFALAPSIDEGDVIGLEVFLSSSVLITGVSEALHRIFIRMTAAEEALRSEERMRAIIDGARDAIVTIDEAGLIRSVSAVAVQTFGYLGEELIGQSFGVLLQDPYRAKFEKYLVAEKALGKPSFSGVGREVEGRRKDGSVFPMELAVIEVNYDDERRFVGFIRDLTERVAAEQRLDRLRAERLNAMGGMAAAMAHELNQPLAATALYLRSAQRLLAMPPEKRPARVEDALDSASAQVIRAGRIISHMRAFVSRGEPEKRFHNLHCLIDEVVQITRAIAQEAGVDLRIELRATADEVLADEVQIKQVLVNLIKNAIEALSESARRQLCVLTEDVEDGMIRVSVIDSGPGLSEKIEAQLFEPFTTTKAGGMGVGLSVCRSIVQAHHGKLWADRNEGGGAIFRFTLPLAREEVEA